MTTTWLKDTLERTAITTDENLGTVREQEEPEVVLEYERANVD